MIKKYLHTIKSLLTIPAGFAGKRSPAFEFLKELILSRPNFEQVPNSKLVEKGQGTQYDYLAATSGKKYAFAYTYNGRNFTVQMG